ncbi:hypothetical protein Bhyg_15282 [Pseudolycoriella hygida]|uniref:Uncharacterized protein n=1 Tax=Pseudolycoriella hygida TaxID=35572 RepID=A0A9Q0MT60_9DIPT|nr:hypothetical protein Bhyg_15282 [Pseudolycoriella hygida]
MHPIVEKDNYLKRKRIMIFKFYVEICSSSEGQVPNITPEGNGNYSN